MERPRFSLALSLCLSLLAITAVRAQETPSSAQVPPCVSDWSCGSVHPPLGFYVDSIVDDGRYVRLEDGTLWEVQVDSRATVAGWQQGNFVEVRRIAAPTGDYEWLFIKADAPSRQAAVRFSGRARR